jgi:hypothetical protein
VGSAGSTHGGDEKLTTFYSKQEGKKLLGGTKLRWNENSRMHLKEAERENMFWIHLSQERNKLRGSIKTVTNIDVSQNAGNNLTDSIVASEKGPYFTESYRAHVIMYDYSHKIILFHTGLFYLFELDFYLYNFYCRNVKNLTENAENSTSYQTF